MEQTKTKQMLNLCDSHLFLFQLILLIMSAADYPRRLPGSSDLVLFVPPLSTLGRVFEVTSALSHFLGFDAGSTYPYTMCPSLWLADTLAGHSALAVSWEVAIILLDLYTRTDHNRSFAPCHLFWHEDSREFVSEEEKSSK